MSGFSSSRVGSSLVYLSRCSTSYSSDTNSRFRTPSFHVRSKLMSGLRDRSISRHKRDNHFAVKAPSLLHILPPIPAAVPKNAAAGECKFGDKCFFRHTDLGREAPTLSQTWHRRQRLHVDRTCVCVYISLATYIYIYIYIYIEFSERVASTNLGIST